MATSLTLQNDTSLQQGYLKVNGSTAATLTTTGIQVPQATIGSLNGILKATGGVVSNATPSDLGSLGSLTLGTVQTASGTSVNFNNIPSWAKRITVMFNGVSTNGTSSYLIRIGDSEGIESTGYTSTAYGQTNVVNTSTSGFIINCTTVVASDARHGLITIATLGSNIWVASGNVSPANGQLAVCSGIKTLSDTLTQVSITTVNGTDTFDAGIINISYEG